MATEQVIEGVTYRTGQLNAKEQFHVARRLAPIVGAMASAVGTGMFSSLADAVSKLEDKDVDYVMRTTMRVVTRQTGDRFMSVWNVQGDAPQFADMTAPVLLQLMIAVIQDNLGGFTNVQGVAGQVQFPIGPSDHLN